MTRSSKLSPKVYVQTYRAYRISKIRANMIVLDIENGIFPQHAKTENNGNVKHLEWIINGDGCKFKIALVLTHDPNSNRHVVHRMVLFEILPHNDAVFDYVAEVTIGRLYRPFACGETLKDRIVRPDGFNPDKCSSLSIRFGYDLIMAAPESWFVTSGELNTKKLWSKTQSCSPMCKVVQI